MYFIALPYSDYVVKKIVFQFKKNCINVSKLTHIHTLIIIFYFFFLREGREE